MLIEFRFKNFRSFRDETVLSMEASGIQNFNHSLIKYGTYKILPAAAIFGKNGGGKSNVIRAFWLAVQFIQNAQFTQHENASVPVVPFALNDYSVGEPTEFEFLYTIDNVKYYYSFAATREKIISECLYHSPKGQKALVFSREGQKFKFSEEKTKRKLISQAVAPNQLFFSVACTMNDTSCIKAMRWFRENILFSRGYSDIPKQLLNYENDTHMLRAISDYAKAADLGIEDIQFTFDSKELEDIDFPESMPEELKNALSQFIHLLSDTTSDSENKLRMGEVKAISQHIGKNKKGESGLFTLGLDDESDGTRRLMFLAPAIESVLNNGGLLIVDEIERELHPMLVDFIVAKFQSKETNKTGAQLIFTTHNIELMNMELLRKDQFYFVDKDNEDGVSELYSISDFGTKTSENIRKGYIAGKYGAIPEVKIEEVE